MKSIVNKSGFTLLEMMIIVVILGVLAAATGPSMISLVSERRFESGVMQFWAYMNNARTIVAKVDAPFVMVMDTTKNTVIAYIDSINNGTLSTSEKISGQPISDTILFALPTPFSGSAPSGAQSLATVSSTWKEGLRVENNATFSIKPGQVYFRNRARPEIGYCLLVRSGSSKIELFKWDGAKWYEM